MTAVVKTIKCRVKDKHSKVLTRFAEQVNVVWNYCNETSHRSIQDQRLLTKSNSSRVWLSGFDLCKMTAGFSKCDGVILGAASCAEVCKEYARRRDQFKKSKLRWRVSNQTKANRSLGWIPFAGQQVKYRNGQIKFAGRLFSIWDSYNVGQYKFRAGSFNQDARGHWYINISVDVEVAVSTNSRSVGIDLGLKTPATSDGEKLEGRWYRNNEKKLASAQRANKKDRVRAIHAKIKNQRKDALHKFTTTLARNYGAVFVGDVSVTRMQTTRLAKSVYDASWYMFKTTLKYKCNHAGVVYEEVDERYTTQTCSHCGEIPTSSPKGRAGLGIREWTCSNCGTTHDRDVNAARNILAVGHGRLVVGNSVV